VSTAFTRQVILVVRPAVADAVNTALKNAAWDPVGGDRTFTVPLRATSDPTGPVVAYWALGSATPTMLTGLRNRMLAAGATSAEASLIPAGTTANAISGQRVYCFDAAVWTPDQVLSLLGLTAP
jgi:hypothetical protein